MKRVICILVLIVAMVVGVSSQVPTFWIQNKFKDSTGQFMSSNNLGTFRVTVKHGNAIIYDNANATADGYSVAVGDTLIVGANVSGIYNFSTSYTAGTYYKPLITLYHLLNGVPQPQWAFYNGDFTRSYIVSTSALNGSIVQNLFDAEWKWYFGAYVDGNWTNVGSFHWDDNVGGTYPMGGYINYRLCDGIAHGITVIPTSGTTFDHWDDCTTNNPKAFPHGNVSRSIYFTTTPFASSYATISVNASGSHPAFSWSAVTNAVRYDIYRKSCDPQEEDCWGSNSGMSLRTSTTSTTWTDNTATVWHKTGENLTPESVYRYYIKAVDVCSRTGSASNAVLVNSDDGFITKRSAERNPDRFKVAAYPNPFNPTTRISFSVAEEGRIRAVVYNSIGQEVAVLADKDMARGEYVYDFDGSRLGSGVYYLRVYHDRTVDVVNLILVK